MTFRRIAAPTVFGLSLCLGATFLSTTPASAASDPEAGVVKSLVGKGEQLAFGDQLGAALNSRALVSSASANARITRVLPKRVSYKSVGKRYGVRVVDVDSGARLWARRSTTPYLPASNMKIVTAVTALRAMGPDKRFTTRVVSLGNGSVAIIGGGDATLSKTGLATLARDAAAAIKARPDLVPVTGKLKVYVDDSLYPTPTRPGGWRSGYQPSVVRPVRPLGIDGSYTTDSSAVAAKYFGTALKSYGFSGTFAGRAATTGSEELASYSGAKLSDQVKYMLQVSENNVAEMLFRNTAIARGYVPGWANSKKAATEILTELGIPLTSVNLADGSGVSRSDRLTGIALTTILQRVADSTTYPELWTVYYGGGMPLAGRTGTLSSGAGRFNTKPTRCAAGKLRAKTGTLFDTVGLSGLAVGKDGRLKAFSILVNSRPQKYSPLTTRRNVDRMAATVTGCY